MLTTQASAGCAEGDEVMPCNSRPPLTLLLLYSCFVKNDVINKRPQVPALWKARNTCAKPPIFSIVIAIFVLHHSLIICGWLTNLPSLNQSSRLPGTSGANAAEHSSDRASAIAFPRNVPGNPVSLRWPWTARHPKEFNQVLFQFRAWKFVSNASSLSPQN